MAITGDRTVLPAGELVFKNKLHETCDIQLAGSSIFINLYSSTDCCKHSLVEVGNVLKLDQVFAFFLFFALYYFYDYFFNMQVEGNFKLKSCKNLRFKVLNFKPILTSRDNSTIIKTVEKFNTKPGTDKKDITCYIDSSIHHFS